MGISSRLTMETKGKPVSTVSGISSIGPIKFHAIPLPEVEGMWRDFLEASSGSVGWMEVAEYLLSKENPEELE